MHRKLHSSHMNKRISSKFCAIIIINNVSILFSYSFSFWFRKIKSLAGISHISELCVVAPVHGIVCYKLYQY